MKEIKRLHTARYSFIKSIKSPAFRMIISMMTTYSTKKTMGQKERKRMFVIRFLGKIPIKWLLFGGMFTCAYYTIKSY